LDRVQGGREVTLKEKGSSGQEYLRGPETRTGWGGELGGKVGLTRSRKKKSKGEKIWRRSDSYQWGVVQVRSKQGLG